MIGKIDTFTAIRIFHQHIQHPGASTQRGLRAPLERPFRKSGLKKELASPAGRQCGVAAFTWDPKESVPTPGREVVPGR